jgi:hypothetical protein
MARRERASLKLEFSPLCSDKREDVEGATGSAAEAEGVRLAVSIEVGRRRSHHYGCKGMAGGSGEAGARPFGQAVLLHWWALQDLNLGPMDYESTALTAELRARQEPEPLKFYCSGTYGDGLFCSLQKTTQGWWCFVINSLPSEIPELPR